ncbi:hypothetical protein Tco_0281142 [Tanacetum coccineum]
MDLETAQITTTAKFPSLKQAKTTNVDGTSTTLIPGPVTTEEKDQKKNDIKARSMLLMALPNEHLMTFNQYRDAKTLNKPDLDIMSFDDLYNNFKIVEQEVKGTASSSSSSNSQTWLLCHLLAVLMKLILLMDQPNGSHLVHEDLEQIHERDGFEVAVSIAEHEDKKVFLVNCSRRTINVEEISSKSMLAIDGAGFDWSFMAYEEVPIDMALMAFSDSEDNLLKGLPIKRFENDQTCVAFLKGKQHKASSSKDETNGILKSFITQIENLVDKKVKIIRCDNGT